uniref:protein-serine/threonine phosphatase n=1 Tax=Kalanchoe fedtschenkoi TaxID=63787 RepID=A0A7N0TMW3_KALFE
MRQWSQEKMKSRATKLPESGGGGGGSEDDELMFEVGLKPHAGGEYSHAVVQANSVIEDQSQVVVSPAATFVGVYDGHGGPEASKFVLKHLVAHVNKFGTEARGLSTQVIRKAFNATEEGFERLVKQSVSSRPQLATVGTCCLFGAILRDGLYIANVGDSRAVLGQRGRDGSVVAVRLSTDHSVGNEKVRKEVEALNPDDKQIVKFCHGVWRIKGILTVSRAIGDLFLKKPGIGNYPVLLKRPAISAEPSILVRRIQPQDLFLIFASDGLWDQLSDEGAVNIVSRSPRAGVAKRLVKAALVEAARKRMMSYSRLQEVARGPRRQIHDDISVVVLYLDQHSSSSNKVISGSRHDTSSSRSAATPIGISSSNTSSRSDQSGIDPVRRETRKS